MNEYTKYMNLTTQLITCLFLLFGGTVQAQFCNTQVGTKLYYINFDAETGVTMLDSAIIEKVYDEEGHTIVVQRDLHKETKYEKSIESEYTEFTYDGKGTTLVTLLSSKMLNNLMLEIALAECKKEEQENMEKSIQDMQKHIGAEGDIIIPLREDAHPREAFPDCSFKYKLSFMRMTTKVKEGKYEGTETVHTPAGEFECLKITYHVITKFALMSESAHVTEWYASNTGLVKREERNKKGKLLTRETLTLIKN